MRAVVQRVSRASVVIDARVHARVHSEIASGLLVFLGVEQGDQDADARYLAEKTTDLRIFNDANGKMNLGLTDMDGRMLVVSQFTLLGDARKGRRPSFIAAADPDEGKRLYQLFVELVRQRGVDVQTGQFQTDMQVELINDGPVTILLDSRKRF